MSYFPCDIPYMSKEGLEENGIRIPNDAINTNAGSDSEIPNSSDLISRQAAISHVGDVPYIKEHPNVGLLWKAWIESLPSAQPERTCVNCGRTANNGGWYADGRTRCPIEEHYALPKDGFCHLWEKRNVTDDDYPERRTDE